MCDVCCKEFKGWCRSFTRTERALTVLEALLLVALLVFLVFLILHLIACSADTAGSHEDTEQSSTVKPIDYITDEGESEKAVESATTIYSTGDLTGDTAVKTKTPSGTTIDPGRECSWTPSAKTTALTHYYEDTAAQTTTKSTKSVSLPMKLAIEPIVEDILQSDQSDGEEVELSQNKYVLALVKLQPPQDVLFGCILTIISSYWVLTSASCIEAIEEVDSLDSFVMMEDYGIASNGKIRAVFDIQIHPFYQGLNKSYDLAALKSESSFVNRQPVDLPTALDYSIITIGERFHLLGFGAYRSIDVSGRGRRLRRVRVYRLAGAQCEGEGQGEGAGAGLRHLGAARALPAAPCAGAAPLCAGGLWARGAACYYCSGAPLLRARLLLAVMADNPHCGAACEPQLYVNLAALRDWLDAVLAG